MVPSSDMIEAGRRFASDLRRIRELREISVDALLERTKMSPDILAAFEENALVDHPSYNRVYLRSFVRTYAEAVEIDAETALAAAEQLLGGRYDGALAAAYLGEEPRPVPPASPEPDESAEEETAEPAPEPVVPVDPEPQTRPEEEAEGVGVMEAFEEAGGDVRSPWVGRLKWIVPGLVVVVLALAWLVTRPEPAPPPPPPMLPIPPPASSDSTDIADLPPRVVLPDTLEVWVVAEGDTLNPVRIRVDGDMRRPYWIEYGDSMMFRVVGRIAVEREMEAVALSVAGYRLPTDRFAEGVPIVYTRVQIQETLDSLRTAQ